MKKSSPNSIPTNSEYLNGRWGGHAHLYVFAYHPVADETADHREPTQWEFYLMPTDALPPPPAKSIALTRIQMIGQKCSFGQHGATAKLMERDRWWRH